MAQALHFTEADAEQTLKGALREQMLVATSLSGATRAAITVHDRARRETKVFVRTFIDAEELSPDCLHSGLSTKLRRQMLPPEEYQRAFKDHPLGKVAPYIKSTAAYTVHSDDDSRWVLTLINPTPEFFSDDRMQTVLERVRRVMAYLVQGSQPEPHLAGTDMHGLREQWGHYLPDPQGETIFRFLKETLPVKARLLSRNELTYAALRTWRKPIKEYQVKALQAIKAGATTDAASAIATEMSAAARKLHGKSFSAVVPVPGGSSGREESLSVLIAQRVAEQLGLQSNNVLGGAKVPQTESHPRKSAKLAPYQIKAPVKGHVLLVDDVATSGRHLELASTALAGAGATVSAMVWVAD